MYCSHLSESDFSDSKIIELSQLFHQIVRKYEPLNKKDSDTVIKSMVSSLIADADKILKTFQSTEIRTLNGKTDLYTLVLENVRYIVENYDDIEILENYAKIHNKKQCTIADVGRFYIHKLGDTNSIGNTGIQQQVNFVRSNPEHRTTKDFIKMVQAKIDFFNFLYKYLILRWKIKN